MSRGMVVVESARIYPAKCACGSVTGPLVDTMFETQLGRVYICARCVDTAAKLLGYVPADVLEAANGQTALWRSNAEEYRRQLDEALATQIKVVPVSELVEAAGRGAAA